MKKQLISNCSCLQLCLRTGDSLQTPVSYSGLSHTDHWMVFWPLLPRRAHLTWKKTKVKPELLSFWEYNCLYICCFQSLLSCWAEVPSQIEHKSEFQQSYKVRRGEQSIVHVSSSMLVVIFTQFLFTNTSFYSYEHLLSPTTYFSVASKHMYVYIGMKKEVHIRHSLKSCNIAAIVHSGGTQKNQCWGTTAPGPSNEMSLGGKTVRVCPEQSPEHAFGWEH